MPARPKWFAWIDLETNGLDPRDNPILEVGMVVTPTSIPFNEIATYESAVEPSSDQHPTWRDDMDSFVVKMHTVNGLLLDIESGNGASIRRVEKEMIEVLADFGRPHQFMLAGSGVGHFDARFLQAQMPEFYKWLQYPCLDVGVIRRAFSFSGRRDLDKYGSTFSSRGGKPHRGLADVQDHLAEFRAYAQIFSNIPTPVPHES